MPTPLIICFFAAVMCIIVEWRFENVKFPKIANWPLKGTAAAILFMLLAMGIPVLVSLFNPSWHPLDLRASNGLLQIAVATLSIQAGVYAWHRLVHAVPWFWEWSHKTHHRPVRVDTWGAFFFHPGDMITAILIQGFIPNFVIRLDTESLAVAGAITIFLSIFQHTNVRTPHWLGYIVTRPESHCLHHDRDDRGYNYGDIALFDMIFGTFRNPRTWNGRAGL